MRVKRGNFLAALGDRRAIVVAPTNGVLTPRGLVMGAGAAKALAEAEPRLPVLFAEAIRREGVYRGGWWEYGLVVVGRYAAFQTKGRFQDRADLRLIHLASSKLRRFLEARPGVEAHLAFPGIGLGGLEPGEVLEVLEEALGGVGDRVVLYRL